MPSSPTQQRIARELLPFLVWLCVALTIRYGYYGNRNLVMTPNSSRILTASSLLVEEVQIKGDVNKGLVLIYGFTKPPELSLESNWTVVNHLDIDSYDRQGLSLWLNKGSKIWMTWEVTYGDGSYGDMYMVLMKGEQNLKEESISLEATDSPEGAKEAQFDIDEDDRYYIGIVNLNLHRVAATLKINVSSKIYDTKEATSICSMGNGPCKLKLSFPNTQYFVLTTNNDVPVNTWYVQLSFVARLAAYIFIVGCVVLFVYLILHRLGACEANRTEEEVATESETQPILPRKEISYTYKTNEEDPTSSLCCSSDDLYEKICAICYDESRSCFFTPCGHSIACRTCAKRIMEEENRVCPVCRRLIHKVRPLVSASKESCVQEKETSAVNEGEIEA